jgi:bifunctional DNA-binding transcriptional regulator/antitoxin component of YhaV-PrlF toxin-antitoxin module
MRTVVPISKGGQISIPATIRRRWDARNVIVEDEGERLVIRPLPTDPIAAAKGRFPLPDGESIGTIMERRRMEDEEAEERRRHGS